MKILVISDTHQNQEMILSILSLCESTEFDEILHLGDDYQDAQPLIDAGFNVTRVPGTWTKEYLNKYIDNRVFENREGWRLFLSHTPEADYKDLVDDPDPQKVVEKGDCDLFLHGHTHKPEIIENGKVVICNPGHLKSLTDRGYPATYAILILTKTELNISIFRHDTHELYDSFQKMK